MLKEFTNAKLLCTNYFYPYYASFFVQIHRQKYSIRVNGNCSGNSPFREANVSSACFGVDFNDRRSFALDGQRFHS